MKHYKLSPVIDMIRFIRSLLFEETDDLAKSLVVFPGRRPGHFLRKYIGEHFGRSYKPPVILSMDELIDHIYENSGKCDLKVNSIDCVPMIFRLNQSIKVINQHDENLTLDDFLPWGFKLFSDFEELYIEHIDPSRVREIEVISEEKIPERIKKKLTVLSQLYKSFYENLVKDNLSTRALRYRTVGDEVEKYDFSKYEIVIFAGFFAMTRSEKRLFKHLVNMKNVSLIFQEGPGVDQHIQALDITVEQRTTDPKPPSINFYQAMNIHGEIFQLNHTLGAEKSFNESKAIVLPLADTLLPLVQQSLGFAGTSYNISMGYPLYRTPLYTLIEILGELLETREQDKLYLPTYLKFIFHPYVKNVLLNRNNEPTRIIFHTIEKELIGQNKRFASLDEIENNQDIISKCFQQLKNAFPGQVNEKMIKQHLHHIHQVLIKEFLKVKSIEEFCDKLLHFVSFISRRSTAPKHAYTVQFIKSFIEVIYELKVSALKDERFQRLHSYFRLLRNYIRTKRCPFVGTPVKGLQVLGFLETRNITFDTVFFLDVNEGIIPHIKKEDTILPHRARVHLRLPTYRDREKIFRYYFTNLIRGAKNVHIYYVESNDKEKSRLVEHLLWRIQRKKESIDVPVKDIFFDVKFSHKNRESIIKTDAIMQFLAHHRSFSATALDTYLRCPVQFFYNKIAGFDERDVIAEELDEKQRGSLVHDILEEFFVHKIGDRLSIRDSDYDTMNGLTERLFEKKYPGSGKGTSFLMKYQIKRRMVDVLDYHRQNLSGIIVRECENRQATNDNSKNYPHYQAKITLSKEKEVAITGKIDRIDKRDGEIMIVDYKTSRNARRPNKDFDLNERGEWPTTLDSVQLPLYMFLFLNSRKDIRPETLNSSLFLLGGRQVKEDKLFKDGVEKEIRCRLFTSYQKAIITLIEEILDPEIPFHPTSDPERMCLYCPYRVLCGRQWLTKKW